MIEELMKHCFVNVQSLDINVLVLHPVPLNGLTRSSVNKLWP